MVAPRAGVLPALEARGGAPEDDGAPRVAPSDHREVPGVVAHALLLLVGIVVLLVDHDEPQRPEGREDGAPGAHRHVRGALPDTAPLTEALGSRELAVEHRHALAEACREAVEELRGQRDLRDEHEHLPAGGQCPRGEGKVDLGLPGPGDPVEEPGPLAVDGGDHVLLVRVQGRRGRTRGERLPGLQPGSLLDGDDSLPNEHREGLGVEVRRATGPLQHACEGLPHLREVRPKPGESDGFQ